MEIVECGRLPMPQLMLWKALRPGAAWPAGPVIVRSLPF
jgi:hypothetical protein